MVYGTAAPRVYVDEDGDEMVAPSWWTEDSPTSQRAAVAWFGKQGRSEE